MNNRKWLLFVCFLFFLMFQQSVTTVRAGRQEIKERETPTEREGYCRRGSGGGGWKSLPGCVALLVCSLLAFHLTHTHVHTHTFRHTRVNTGRLFSLGEV